MRLGGTEHTHWHRRCAHEILVPGLRGFKPVNAGESGSARAAGGQAGRQARAAGATALGEHGKALIVNTVSIAGKGGQAWLAVYSATKAGDRAEPGDADGGRQGRHPGHGPVSRIRRHAENAERVRWAGAGLTVPGRLRRGTALGRADAAGRPAIPAARGGDRWERVGLPGGGEAGIRGRRAVGEPMMRRALLHSLTGAVLNTRSSTPVFPGGVMATHEIVNLAFLVRVQAGE